jgi:preprotein translocase subunit Sss1
MVAAYNEVEKTCIKKLAQLFEEGKTSVEINRQGIGTFGLLPGNLLATLKMMEERGFIGDVVHSTGGFFDMFSIRALATLEARAIITDELKKPEGKDYVESLKLTLKPACVFLLFTAIGFLAVVTHNIMAVLQDFHIISK